MTATVIPTAIPTFALIDRVSDPGLLFEVGNAVWSPVPKVSVLIIREGLARAVDVVETALGDEEMGSVIGFTPS